MNLLLGQGPRVPGVIRAITSLAMLMTQFITKLASFVTMFALVATFVPSAAFAEDTDVAPALTQQATEDTTASHSLLVTGSIATEEFVTVDGSFKGMSVGFRTANITDATAASVTVSRADGSSVTKTANQGVIDIINASGQITAPFVIKEGSFTETGDTFYWNPAPAAWSPTTRPVSVTISVTTAGNGVLTATNSTFNDGAPSWPTYESLLSSALVDSQAELVAAIANPNFETITVENDFSVSSMVTVNRAVTIDGAGKTISGNYVRTDHSNNSVLLVTVSGVTISDLVVDGGMSTNNLHGINIYQTDGVTLSGVTVMNANAGVIVNDSDVTVTNITTKNNRWGGINVDKGSATLAVNGTSFHSDAAGKPAIWKDNNALVDVVISGALEQYTASVQPVNATTGTLYFLSTVKDEAELASALTNANIPTITLGDSFVVNAPVAVNRAVEIKGNGKTISVGSGLSTGSVVLLTASDVTISDLTVNGNDREVHGLQAYAVSDIVLTGLTVKDNGKSGLLVNGSGVTVTDLTTSGNGWNGVNVDRGVNVSSEARLTVNGTSTHDEDTGKPAIWIDDNAKTLVSVIDTNSQYVSNDFAWVKGGVTPLVGIQYFLKSEVVAEEDSNRDGRSGGSRRTTTTTSAGAVDGGASGEGQVLGASTYNFKANLTIGSTGADVNALQEMLIASGHLAIAAPTGYFGEMTKAALAKWQAAHGVPATGYFGPLTIAAIAAAPAPVMSAEARAALLKDLLAKVKELQEKLDAMN